MMKLLLALLLLACCCCRCWPLLVAPAPVSAEPLPVAPLLRAARSPGAPDEAASKTAAAAAATTATTQQEAAAAAASTPSSSVANLTESSTTAPQTTTTTASQAEVSSASKTITNSLQPPSGEQTARENGSESGAISAPPMSAPAAGSANSLANNSTGAQLQDGGLPMGNSSAVTWAPRSERAHILEMFHKFFLQARSHDDQQRKEFVRDGVILRMRQLGFQNSFIQKSRFEFRRRPSYSDNMISILAGPHRGTAHDQILLVGAHWDSATKAPGVDDNGSGSTCLLEIARLLASHKCSFNHTIMLVWFDYEEQGKYGSEFFVNDYLYPYELDKYKSRFIGAYILDMILVRDKEMNSQQLPANLRPKLPEFFEELDREKNRGDFLATWARKRWDEPLEATFRWAWQQLGHESRTFKAMRPELPQRRMPNAEERYQWKDFFRSDHASFWFPPLTSPAVRKAPNRTSSGEHASLNAILLTDLGPWRQSYKNCYHSACDDQHLLTDGNLAFMQQVVDALVLSLMRAGEGRCATHEPAGQPGGAAVALGAGAEALTPLATT